MKVVTLIARLLLGLVFFGSGIAFFFMTPPPMEGAIAKFFEGMTATGYFFNFLKGTEVVCGLLLLSGYFVPLALVILAPIVINIFLVHYYMAPDGLIVAIAVGVLQVYLSFLSPQYSPAIRQLFRPK